MPASSRSTSAQGYKKRVGVLSAILLIGIALVCDAAQFFASFLHVIPVAGNAAAFVIGSFVGITAQIILTLGFALCGVTFFGGKRSGTKLLAILGPAVTEFIPLLNAVVPAATAGAISMVIISRIEDAERHKEQKARLKDASELENKRRAQETARTAQQIPLPQPEEPLERDPTTVLGRGEAGGTNVMPKKKSVESRPWEKPTAPIPDFRPPEQGFQ